MTSPANPVDFAAYFASAAASFERAFAQGGQSADVKIGAQRWRLRFTAAAGAEHYFRAFSHLELPDAPDPAAALTVCLWDYESSGDAPPRPSWAWTRRLPHSQESRFDEGRYTAAEGFDGFYILLDWIGRRALVWHPGWSGRPSWEFASPLRDLIELWFKPSDLIRLHAAGIGTESGGVLLVGKSGSGKSTTSLACLLAGLGYAGDDYVLVDSRARVLYSLYSSGKLVPDNLVRLPQLMPYVDPLHEAGDEKTIFALGQPFRAQMLSEFPLRALFVPHLTGASDSRLLPISPIHALQALAPSTLLQAADPTPREFEKIARIARALPCFRLDTGTDLDQLTGLVKDYLRHA